MVKMYTMKFCPFCESAKRLLKSKGIPFEETLVAEDDDATWDALYKKSGMQTMPQIFHNDRLIGGFQELSELDKKDGLLSLR